MRKRKGPTVSMMELCHRTNDSIIIYDMQSKHTLEHSNDQVQNATTTFLKMPNKYSRVVNKKSNENIHTHKTVTKRHA